MKKLLLMLAVVVSIVGCEESGEKAADKITDESTSAQELVSQGALEYQEAVSGKQLSEMSLAELDASQAKLTASRTHLSQARAKYQHILDIDSDNDQVKLINRDEIKQMIVKIDRVLGLIETEIQNVNATREVRLAERN